MILAFSTVLATADTGMKVNEQPISAGGSVDVAMTKDHMAVITSGGVDFFDMNYSNFQWVRVQSEGIPGASSVDIDGEFAIVGAPLSAKNVEYLYTLEGDADNSGTGVNHFHRYDVAE